MHSNLESKAYISPFGQTNIQRRFSDIIELVHRTKEITDNASLRADVHEKGKSDYVTAIDYTISKFLKAELEKILPIGFMSEEDNQKSLDKNRWILDPIDGTTNLIFDYRLSSISLALMLEGSIVFGVVYNPFTEETFYAEKGGGAYLNGQRLEVSDHSIGESLIEFSAGARRKQDADESFRIAKEVFEDCIDVRHICSSALSISYVAARRIDGFFEKVLNPWDYAAASLILQEAGGIITDWAGNSIQFDKPSSIIAANKNNYQYLLSKISSVYGGKKE